MRLYDPKAASCWILRSSWGVVLKVDLEQETQITDENLHHYVGGLVLCNDVSARDFMFGAPMLQWFRGKGQRTFCPARTHFIPHG